MMQRTVGVLLRNTNRQLATGGRTFSTGKPSCKERSVNKVTLMGRVGKTPDVREFKDNTFVNFPVATSYLSFDKDTGEWVEGKTQWHSVSLTRPSLVNYVQRVGLDKGDRVYLEGSIAYRIDNNDVGSKIYRTNIFADSLFLLAKSAKTEYVQEDAEERL